MEMDAAEPERYFCDAQMSDVSTTTEIDDPPMHEREIALADGRYMIFYTFGDEAPPSDDQAENV